MRICARFYKHDEIKFVSHLDMQRLFQRAFRRAKLPLSYSKGFNPHPLLSFATALSVGYTSECEYLDITLDENIEIDEFIAKVNNVLPDGVKVTKAWDLGECKTSLTSLMRYANYKIILAFETSINANYFESIIASMLNGEIIVQKKTKGGVKAVDIRPLLISITIKKATDNFVELHICGKLTTEGGLPVELLLSSIYEKLGVRVRSTVNRTYINLDRTVSNQ